MTLQAAVGIAQALDGREAGLQAAHQALNRLGAGTPGLGILIASHQFQAREVATGVASLLSDVPLIGFSSPAGLTNSGQHTNSVVLALLKGRFGSRGSLASQLCSVGPRDSCTINAIGLSAQGQSGRAVIC